MGNHNRSPEYVAWAHIKARCLNPGNANYPRYGGRGITVCDRWCDSYEAFLADVGRRPSADHSIDRIDNNGNYEPGNCRWATRREQLRNTRQNRLISAQGETRCAVEWAEILGVRPGLLFGRVHLGWSDEQIVTTPVLPFGTYVLGSRAPQTECRRGHPFDEANTYVRSDGRRMCRPCQQARNPGAVLAYRARKRAQRERCLPLGGAPEALEVRP